MLQYRTSSSDIDVSVKVVCGDGHTLTLTNKGEVYAWGDNYYGQVGVNSNRKPSIPTVVYIYNSWIIDKYFLIIVMMSETRNRIIRKDMIDR